MLKLHTRFGIVWLEVSVAHSAVDSFVESGYSEALDRELTDKELNHINEAFSAEIQQYAWENGSIETD